MDTGFFRHILSVCILCHACGGPDAPTDPLLVARPFQSHVPQGYDPATPTPLVILLHSYTMSGALTDKYFAMSKASDPLNFLYAFPDGTQDESSQRFWNATDGCCNLFGAQVDDVAYLKAIIKDMKARYNVDPKRIFLVGHSNGGFMSYRMACDAADDIAAIMSLSGATWNDPARCRPSQPVSVLEVHGDMDPIIHYDGGLFVPNHMLANYPSSHSTVAQAAANNGCTGMLMDTKMPIDVDTSLPGAETRVERYQGCQKGAVERWTIQGGGHFPVLSPEWAKMIYGFLMAHPKP